MLQLRRKILTSLNFYKISFYSADGSTLLWTQFVERNKNCPEPVSAGIISTPTKSATEEYIYTFDGWSSSIDGTANSQNLNNITANKKLYVAFNAVRRCFNIYKNGTFASGYDVSLSGKYGANYTYTVSGAPALKSSSYLYVYTGKYDDSPQSSHGIGFAVSPVLTRSVLSEYTTLNIVAGGGLLTTTGVECAHLGLYSSTTPTESNAISVKTPITNSKTTYSFSVSDLLATSATDFYVGGGIRTKGGTWAPGRIYFTIYEIYLTK